MSLCVLSKHKLQAVYDTCICCRSSSVLLYLQKPGFSPNKRNKDNFACFVDEFVWCVRARICTLALTLIVVGLKPKVARKEVIESTTVIRASRAQGHS